MALSLALAGCGHKTADGAGAANPAPSGADGFTAAAAAGVLAEFDKADSAASSAGDLTTLGTLETSPALDVSTAAVRKAQVNGRTQPPFRHLEPAFALPAAGAADPSCFLVAATLQLSGGEIGQHDVSQFVRAGDGWKLSHNILASRDAVPMVGELAGKPAVVPTAAIEETRRRSITAEIFARTTATVTPNQSLVAPSTVLDRQLAAGWSIYQQQMGTAGMKVTRALTGSEWSACGAATGTATITFLTLYATDTVTGTAGNRVTLPSAAPDLAGTGHRDPVQGTSVKVDRVEVFLLSVPGGAGGAVTVLGLGDAPTKVTPVEQ
ncbi:hypothetical protein [Dactylosporangium sp. CA-092794]|uniref:hypothetical protein n=1 Tax=Dactylosporangium sp. CA-092794 TaxID=3239929 RepID=UPI003D8EAD4E